jgi:fatty-acyl-CoA synthase
MDKDGYLYHRQSKRNVYSGWIQCLSAGGRRFFKAPKTEAVSIVGVPDERLGEVVAAFIRLKKGERASEMEIIEYCKESIANIKVPRYVFFVDEFPLNPQGKVQKFKQREWAIDKLKLKELK